MSLDAFMTKFGATEAPAVAFASTPESLDKFLTKFAGDTKSYWFYENTIELRFDVESHIYYLVGPLGELIEQDGVTNVLKVIDKSNALVPWAAKKTVEKVLRLMPRVTKQEPVVTDITAQDYIDAGGPTYPVEYIAEMTLADFEKLLQEAKSAHRDILNDAGDVGHMAHTWLEYYVQACIAKDEQSKETKLLNMPEDPRAKNCCLAALKWMTAHNVRWLHTERKIYSKKYGYAGTLDGICTVDSCTDRSCCPREFKDRLTLSDWKSSNGLRMTYRYQCASYRQAIEEELGLAITDIWILRLGKEDGEFEPWHITSDDFQEDLAGFLDALSLTRSIRLTEETMKGQKAERKDIAKEIRETAKAEEKAAKKIERAAAAAVRKTERDTKREEVKAAKKAEREAAKVTAVTAEPTEFDTASDEWHASQVPVAYGGLEIKEIFVDEAQHLPAPSPFTPEVQALIDATLAWDAEQAGETNIVLLGAETGRTSCAQENLANTPKELPSTTYRDIMPDVPVVVTPTATYGLPEEVVTGSR